MLEPRYGSSFSGVCLKYASSETCGFLHDFRQMNPDFETTLGTIDHGNVTAIGPDDGLR